MTVSNEAVEAARQALHRVRWERMKRMIEGDRRALGEREPGDPPDMQEDARAALEAAAPFMLPAPEGVSEAEIVRHMTHEEWRGCRIENYRWKFKIPEALQGSEWDWSYASHWSTPAAHEEAEALVSVKDAERALLSALSSERERAADYKQAFETADRLLGNAQARADQAEFLLALALECAQSAQAEATRLKEKLDEAGKVIAPFAGAGTLAGPRGEHGDFWAYLPAAGPEFGIAGDHLRAALRWTEEASQREGE